MLVKRRAPRHSTQFVIHLALEELANQAADLMQNFLSLPPEQCLAELCLLGTVCRA